MRLVYCFLLVLFAFVPTVSSGELPVLELVIEVAAKASSLAGVLSVSSRGGLFITFFVEMIPAYLAFFADLSIRFSDLASAFLARSIDLKADFHFLSSFSLNCIPRLRGIPSHYCITLSPVALLTL